MLCFRWFPPDGDDVSGVASLQNVIQSDPPSVPEIASSDLNFKDQFSPLTPCASVVTARAPSCVHRAASQYDPAANVQMFG